MGYKVDDFVLQDLILNRLDKVLLEILRGVILGKSICRTIHSEGGELLLLRESELVF